MKKTIISWIKSHEFWLGVLALSIAFGSYTISKANLDAAAKQARTSLYIEFKQRFEKFRRSAPPERKNPNYIAEPGAKGWKYFVDYWHHSFDEWFATTVLLSPERSKLWNEYYGPSIHDALGKKYYLQAICNLLNGGEVSFPAQKEAFRKSLIELYRNNELVPQCLSNT